MPVQEPVKPGLVQFTVLLVVRAEPLTLAVPVQRGPTPSAFGAVSVNVPLKLELVTVPVIVPFQSKAGATHVPLTLLALWENCTFTAAAFQLDDCRFPVQFPESCAKFDGAFGFSDPHAETSTAATTITSTRI